MCIILHILKFCIILHILKFCCCNVHHIAHIKILLLQYDAEFANSVVVVCCNVTIFTVQSGSV